MRSNLEVLIAQKNQQPDRAGRKVTLRSLSKELSISRYTIYALANNDLEEYPRGVIESICNYFDCDVGDLLTMRDIPDIPDQH